MILTDPLISDDYGGWWQRTLALIARAWPQLLTLQAIGTAVSLTCESATARLDSPLWATPLAVVVDALVYTVITLAVVRLVVFTAAERPPALGDCVRGAAPAALPLIWRMLMFVLIVVAGGLLLVLPGVFALLVLTLLAPVVAVERGAGILRCLHLFGATWRAALPRSGTILLIIGGVPAVVEWLTPAGTGAAADVRETVLAALTSAIVGLITGPLAVTAYADLRAREEREMRAYGRPAAPVSAVSIAGQLRQR
ncbi:hypothetical protein [Actinoplanes philippinensis]|uniref:hypothetical protein n=1 Tax=Actinoplanes philippinensis TaxID=35752 RepID=UPI0033CFA0D0